MSTITILDGGLGQELVRRSGDAPTHQWSMRIMRDHPELVTHLHRDYFAAGAEIATANTYALQRDRLEGTDFEDQFEALYDLALHSAEQARRAHGTGRIAGALGPLNGSYRPDAHPDLMTAIPRYAECAMQMQGRVDLVICETVASVAHARAALAGAHAAQVPVWLAVTVADEDGTRLRSGEDVRDIVPIARDEGAAALLVNCSAPEAIPAALRALGSADLPLGAYANAFAGITDAFKQARSNVGALTSRSDLGPARYADHVLEWCAQGASIVGGCCETRPAHIAEIVRRLRAEALMDTDTTPTTKTEA